MKFSIYYNLQGGYFEGSKPREYVQGEELDLVNPTRDGDFVFVGWEYNGKIITKITPDMKDSVILKAIWQDNNVYYTVTYETNGGDFLNTPKDKVPSIYANYTLPLLSKAGYTFNGWYTEPTFVNKIEVISGTVTANITLYAKFTEYENKYVSFLGDSITTFSGYLADNSWWSYYPRTKIDVSSVNDTWWMQLVNKLNYKFLSNSSYSGTQLAGGDYAGSSKERLEKLSDGVHNPDIVVIYMGTNDWAYNCSAQAFKTAYISVIDYIRKNFGSDTEIYVCLMPINTKADEWQVKRETLNSVIVELADEYDLPVIDFRNVITKDNLQSCTGEDVHPNKYGMTLMANESYKVISANESKKVSN